MKEKNMDTYFEKVSYAQFKKDWMDAFNCWDESDDAEIRDIYEGIKLPERSTYKSAGYDFYSPINLCFKQGESIMIPTGIRCHMSPKFTLMMFARSGLGTKHRLVVSQGTGIIDADYVDADNEGHIFMSMINEGYKRCVINQGQAFCQGVLMKHFVTDNDQATASRKGGFGSTDKK